MTEPRRYVLGRHESRSLLGGRERGEVATLIGGVAMGVIAAVAGGATLASFVLLSVIVGAAAGAVFVPFRGRTLYRWLPLDLRHLRAERQGTNAYTNDSPEAGFRLEGGEVDVEPPRAVGRLKWLAVPYRSGHLGVVAQQDDGGVVVVLEIEDPVVGLYDAVEQEASPARWGAVLR